MRWFSGLGTVCCAAILLIVAAGPDFVAVAQDDGAEATIAAQEQQISALQTQVAALSTLDGTATPSPATAQPDASGPGSILYQADDAGGFDQGELPRTWKYFNGMLITDGSEDSYLFAVAPVDLANVSDYAIEAEIQLARSDWRGGFGLFARAPRDGGGYFAGYEDLGQGVPGGPKFYLASETVDYYRGGMVDEIRFDPGVDWHTYRLEVKGNEQAVFIDDKIIFRTTDNVYLEPGRIGLWNGFTQIAVRSFKVTSL